VIGTMNVADRSLALVDLALRRRFAFVALEPRFDAAWRAWCQSEAGIPGDVVERIGARMSALNDEVTRTLGPQFAVGHSYLTPARGRGVPNPLAWFRAVVETEIAPLLEEYWYENLEKAKEQANMLLKT
jgi:5-methylcytosine-specific restriction enzyme B